MGQMTKIQFDTIRSLSVAYRHEWATNLDFAQTWAKGTEHEITRGESFRRDVAENDDADLAAWIALHDRIESGYVPTTEEIEALATPLFLDDHFPSTPWVCLSHETCTGRTKWRVNRDGDVWFGFYVKRDDSYDMRPICEVRSWITRNGTRVAQIDMACPISEWSDDSDASWGTGHGDRVSTALAAIGCSQREIAKAFELARMDKLIKWRAYAAVVVEGGIRRTFRISPFPGGREREGRESGVILAWDGDSVSVVDSWGASLGDPLDLALEALLICPRCDKRRILGTAASTFTEQWRRLECEHRQKMLTSVKPSKRIVGGTRRRRNARRRVNR